jgi:hypothetical protein
MGFGFLGNLPRDRPAAPVSTHLDNLPEPRLMTRTGRWLLAGTVVAWAVIVAGALLGL